MPHLKLMKLMYLADRKSYDLYGESISNDRACSLDYGPVLSTTLNIIGGYVRPHPDGWLAWISDKADNRVSLVRPCERKALDELSDADIEILDEIFDTYGHMDRWELVRYTHTLPEWVDPEGSSLPIATQDILHALGKTPEQITAIMENLGDYRRMSELMASL